MSGRPHQHHAQRTGVWRTLSAVGPGLVIAATGVGAGDLVAATVSGSRFGFAVAWAAVVGAALKFTLNEGLARWQLATGTTLLEGWVRHLGRWVQYAFLVYLVVWSFVVGGALISACGLAAHALAPAVSVEAWAVLHSLAAAALVLGGGYRALEKSIKLLIATMFAALIASAVFAGPPLESLVWSIRRAGVPHGAVFYILGVVGGVGGSVTLLSYGYWIREKGWEGPQRLRLVRIDLLVAYALTGMFGLAVMVLAARVLHGQGVTIQGNDGVVQMGAMLGNVVGRAGYWVFLVGFWGAVSTSLLGVWQGVPYLFCDFVGLMRGLDDERQRRIIDTRSPWYRGYLMWLCLAPLFLLYFERPVQLIVVYSVMGAMFMPFLAGTLLYMNSRRDWVGDRLRNRGWAALGLLLCLALFGGLFVIRLGSFWS